VKRKGLSEKASCFRLRGGRPSDATAGRLGDYRLSQVWYERALKADPNHVLTWQYYGLWQIEQGNRDQARYHLSRIAAICGTDCEERSLADALEKPPGTGLVY
jgi:tetratricopeptide (TPR) repeat protein